jgi:hypothetical protein
MMEHADGPAVLKRLCSRVLRDYTARCAARADVRDQECAADREWSMHADEVHCSAVREGTLAKARDGSDWTLMMVWHEKYGSRVLARGSREHVERCAVDVAIHGPPGGPEFGDQRPGWRCLGGDDTLHAVTIGGELRMMPLVTGEQLLMLARNDAALSVLAVGEPEALQRTAHERMLRSPGEALFVRIGEQRVLLRGSGAAGVLGHVDLFDGTRLMLGHLGGDYYGLLVVRDGKLGECVGLYCFAELRRGDLGQVLSWNHRTRGAQDRPADPEVGPEPEARVSLTAPRSDPALQPSPLPLLTCRQLSLTDLALIDRHLNFDPSGPGATIVPTLLAALRALARLELANRVMRGCDLRRLIKKLCKIEIHCCAKTFGRALAAIAAHMRAASPRPAICLLSPVGKRWLLRWGDLQLVDSELLGWIARTTPPEAGTTTAPPAAASVRAPESPAPDPTPTSTSGPADSWSPVELSREQAPAASGEASSPEPAQEEATPPDPQAHATPPDAATTFDDDELARSLAEAQRRRRPWQPDGRLRPTMGRLPAEESASQWSGRKKARDPPDEPE